jgi:RimJ/RimL family protein N-acetyltransferase
MFLRHKGKKLNKRLRLELIRKSDYRFLYELLSEREPSVNISHRKMPTYKNHVKFVLSKPYSKWYIIKYGLESIGSVYLSKLNEIGIHIKKEYQYKKFEDDVLKMLLQKNQRSRYIVNISPKNLRAIRFFKKKGFKLIQYSFELRSENVNERKN